MILLPPPFRIPPLTWSSIEKPNHCSLDTHSNSVISISPNPCIACPLFLCPKSLFSSNCQRHKHTFNQLNMIRCGCTDSKKDICSERTPGYYANVSLSPLWCLPCRRCSRPPSIFSRVFVCSISLFYTHILPPKSLCCLWSLSFFRSREINGMLASPSSCQKPRSISCSNLTTRFRSFPRPTWRSQRNKPQSRRLGTRRLGRCVCMGRVYAAAREPASRGWWDAIEQCVPAISCVSPVFSPCANCTCFSASLTRACLSAFWKL